MAMPLSPLGNLPPAAIAAPAPVRETRGEGAFEGILTQSIARVEALRTNAGEAIGNLLAGEGEELHTVALAAQRAELGFELFLQVRNKVVQAYQEVMRMQM